MKDQNLPQVPAGESVLFSADDGRTQTECRVDEETLWLSQATVTRFYGVHTGDESANPLCL